MHRLAAASLAVVALVTGCGGPEQVGQAVTAPIATSPTSAVATAGGAVAVASPAPPVTEPAPATSPPALPPTTAAPTEPTAPEGPVEVVTSTVAEGLEAPWDVVFPPDGPPLVSERDSGRILAIEDGGATQVAQLPEEGGGEGGLLGLALSPGYAEDALLYAYYSTGEDNRVVRFRLGEEPEPVLTGIPVGRIHNGGRIAFGPDGMLYVGTGETGATDLAQDVDSLGGKILRVTPDGTAPPDNPVPGSPVWSLGHRNVQGLAWDASGQLYASEFGQNTFDELNRITPGGNHGWPAVEGAGGDSAYVDPIQTWATSEASPSGLAILAGGAVPQWEGDAFLAGLRGETLWHVDLDEAGAVAGREALLDGEAGRLRDVAQAPDGSLWVLTSNRDGRGSPGPTDDRILRLGPATRALGALADISGSRSRDGFSSAAPGGDAEEPSRGRRCCFSVAAGPGRQYSPPAQPPSTHLTRLLPAAAP